MNLSDIISARIDRASQSAALRIGLVVGSADGLLEVQIHGVTHADVRYVDSYTPALADEVVLSTIQNQWIVMGKLSRSQSGGTVTTGLVDPISRHIYANYGGPHEWPEAALGQGKYAAPLNATMRGMWIYPTLIPAGSTILSAKLTIACVDTGADLVTPKITAHSYLTPPASVASWLEGPIGPGSLANGQTGVFDIPAAWWEDIEDGVIRGFGLTDDTAANRMRSGTEAPDGRVTLTYIAPTI